MLYLTTVTTKEDEEVYEIKGLNLKTGSTKSYIQKGHAFALVDFSRDGTHVAIIMKGYLNNCCIIALETGAVTEQFNHDLSITCLQWHPTNLMLAIGDAEGVICLLNNICTKESKTVKTTLHWHASSVKAIRFTADGVYLLSGGMEATLVLWQLESGKKDFFPRLPSSIKSIDVSPDQSHYALALGNNSIILIATADMAIKRTIGGLRAANNYLAQYPMSVGLLVSEKTNCLVLNGAPSTLQFINPETCDTVVEIDLSIRNRVVSAGVAVQMTHVSAMAFSGNGNWMVTNDTKFKVAPKKEAESILKFWQYEEESQCYRVNTMVTSPHEYGIRALDISKDGKFCATVGIDKVFRIWNLENEGDDEHWVCRHLVPYKGLQCFSVHFSEDSSLLAVGFERLISLWDPKTAKLQKVLTFPTQNRREAPLNIKFLNNCHHIVASTSDSLHVWNLLSCNSNY